MTSMPKKQSKKKLPSRDGAKTQVQSDQAMSLAQFVAQVWIVGEQFEIKSKPLSGLSLSQGQ